MLERSQPAQPQQAPQVDYDDMVQHMAALMRLYRSEALDTVRGCGGERELWAAASQHLAHAAQIDPRTGETLLRVADGHTERGAHLLQALHVAAGASAWQAHGMPAVGLPVPLTPAVDFRSVELAAAQWTPAADMHAQPDFLVGGHEALEVMVRGEPQTAGKLVVAAPDVASHIVHTRSPCPTATKGSSTKQLQRMPLQREVQGKLGRRVWPAHQALAATNTSQAVVLDATLGGRSVGRTAANVLCDVALHCDGEAEGPDRGCDQRDQRSVAGMEECQGVESENQGDGVDMESGGISGTVRIVPQGTVAGHAGNWHRKRRVPSPRMLRVGIAEESKQPQAQQLDPRSDLVQCALKAKAADRVLLSDLDVKVTSQQ